ncbi:MAG: hypothetical protein ACI9CU_001864, partial [Polaribacter sp.]
CDNFQLENGVALAVFGVLAGLDTKGHFNGVYLFPPKQTNLPWSRKEGEE